MSQYQHKKQKIDYRCGCSGKRRKKKEQTIMESSFAKYIIITNLIVCVKISLIICKNKLRLKKLFLMIPCMRYINYIQQLHVRYTAKDISVMKSIKLYERVSSALFHVVLLFPPQEGPSAV